MALSVIIILYLVIGFLAAAGSISISQKLFSAKAEQIFFGLFLIVIAAFYLAFTTYFGNQGAWQLEAAAVSVFAVFGLIGVRVPVMLIVGYLLHSVWDVLHEIHAHGGGDLFGAQQTTQIPLAYGAFCMAYDWCMAAYFYTRRRQYASAWTAPAR
jgi:membrane protease YdiL (CAAX protease family)